MLLIPIERCLRVTLHMRSGARIRFTADKISKEGGGNGVTTLSATAAPRFPFHTTLVDISAITDRRGWRYRKPRWFEIMIWIIAIDVVGYLRFWGL